MAAGSNKRKTPAQLQALEGFYLDEKFPIKTAMEDYAVGLGLTYKKVRGWFIERRRREKKETGVTPLLSRCNRISSRSSGKIGVSVTSKKIGNRHSLVRGDKIRSTLSKLIPKQLLESNVTRKGKYKQKYTHLHDYSMNKNRTGQGKEKLPVLIQDLLLTPDYILKKIFRKDGPPLGVEFDCLPSRAFGHIEDYNSSRHGASENQRAVKRRKVLKPASLDHQHCNKKSAQVKKSGIGKGLMTVWRATNPDGGDFPTGVHLGNREITSSSPIPTSVSRKPVRKKKLQRMTTKERKQKNNLKNKRKPPAKQQVVQNKIANQNQPYRKTCELSLAGVIAPEHLEQYAMLVDDEELELREIQAVMNSRTCTSHFGSTGMHSCSLCKDLLAKFPPSSVMMKQPFNKQSWISSPESVKKLFKVFHFLYTYSVLFDMQSFTIDEFAQAFHDKHSLLLAEVHMALLKVLLADVEVELSRDCLPRLGKSCKFLGLLHSIEHQRFAVGFWRRSLNPLTWTEILRQVLVASSSGSQNDSTQRESLSKEVTRMVKYGLSSGTLKGELFSLLSEQGNNGMKVSELAKSYQIVELNLASTNKELENLIYSTLSSDITLFEKISSSAYRLRVISVTDEANNYESDTHDSGSVDDNSEDNGTCSDSDESENDSGRSDLANCRQINRRKSRNVLRVCTEIDESHPGEVWLLGLAEGEYSDLKFDEKLNALVALVDLLDGGSGIRMEDPTRSVTECMSNNLRYPSGGKIKRSSTMQHHSHGQPSHHAEQNSKLAHTSSESSPIDSSTSVSKFYGMQESYCNRNNGAQKEGEVFLHPMQSVFLGSDRRYNRYWLFLGPCTSNDPGHRRVYFESSEDGHWEVIDAEEDFHALLSVLDDRGKREAQLVLSLEKRKTYICQEMSNQITNVFEVRLSTISDQSELDREDGSSPVSNVDNNVCVTEISKRSLAQSEAITVEVGRDADKQQWNRSRLQAFDAWIWRYFYLDFHAVKHGKSSYFDSLVRCECCHDLYWRDEKHCKICHETFELDFDLEDRYAIHVATCREKEDVDSMSKHKVLSSQLQSLKAAIHPIESAMPKDSLVSAWTKSAHRVWVKRLRRTSSLAELLQVLTDFVGAINEEWLCDCNLKFTSNNVADEMITRFSTMPQTFSAVALWLVKLDAVIAFYLNRDTSKKQKEKDVTHRGSRLLLN